jgi:hypothetical protein
MSLKKRHIGRRVAGVGVGVALMVLGLQAPAFAAPTISALSPTNGPNDCVVVVTGTGFTTFPEAQMDVDFVRTGDTDDVAFLVISDTTIWAVPDSLDTGFSYNVRVEDPGTPGGVTSSATYLATATAAGCAPTITSFTPSCGPAGTVVAITGTNLIDSSFNGAEVKFSPYGAGQVAAHTVPDVSDVTALSVIVPAGTGDGPISVQTDVGGAVFSATSYLVPPPDCAPVTGNEHARSITLKLKRNGKASGVVSSTEAEPFTACVAEVPVKFKFKPKGKSWKNAGSTVTDDQGNYSKKLKGKPGKYKAIATKVSIGEPVTDVCLKARSPIRKIK